MNTKMDINDEGDVLPSFVKESVNKFKTVEERNKRRKAFIWSAYSIAGYIWDVARNLIVIAVILLIYGALYGTFETITVSILILIYSTLVTNSAVLWQQGARSTLQAYHQGMETRKRLGQSATDEEEEELEQASFALEKVQIKFIINSIASAIIYVFVLFNLFGAF